MRVAHLSGTPYFEYACECLAQFRHLIKQLVALFSADSEPQPTSGIGQNYLLRSCLGAFVHSDAAQAAGKIQIDVSQLDVDQDQRHER
jgi:cysteine sulfinate desulfinase/cysteine desulfurase-like protein